MIIFFLCIVLISVMAAVSFQDDRDVFYIGLAGPMTGPNAKSGAFMQKGAELAIEEVNRSGLLKNIRLKLHVVDDQSDYNSRYFPIECARQLVENPSLLAVAGHLFSKSTLAAMQVYEKHHIPVVSPSATYPSVTSGSDWAYSIMFNDIHQADFIGNYVAHGMKKGKIAIIHSRIEYGEILKTHFIRGIERHGRYPYHVVDIPHADFDPESLHPHLNRLQDADIIYLATLHKNASAIVKYLKNNNVHADFIGGDAIGGILFLDETRIYAEDIYAVTSSSFLPSLLGEDARRFQKTFRQTFQMETDWIASHTYEVIRLIAHCIREAGPDRFAIKRFLDEMKHTSIGVESIGGKIQFDKDGACIRPIFIGQVKDGKFVSANFQLLPVQHPALANKSEGTGDFIHLRERLYKRSRVVFAGVFIKKIEKFDVGEASFVAEFRMWLRWTGEKDEHIDFEFYNGKAESIVKVEEEFDEPAKEHFIAYDIRARFTGDFPLHEYPFDEQVLKIQVKLKTHSMEDLLLVDDLDTRSSASETLDIGIWEDAGHLHYVSGKEFIHSFRNPRYDKKMYRLNYSLFTYSVRIKRKVIEYLVKMAPLAIIMSVVFLTFIIDIENFAASRIAIGITSLLSSVAFHMSQSTVLNVGYLIKLDYFFMATYFFIFLGILETVISNFYFLKNKKEVSQKIDMGSRFLFPALFVGTIALFYL